MKSSPNGKTGRRTETQLGKAISAKPSKEEKALSGLGSFKTISSYNPVNPIHIGNVENIQQPDVNPQPANAGGAQPQNMAPEKVDPRELSRQLDILLLQAGKAAMKGIDATTLKAKVSGLGLGKGELKALNNLIDAAAKKLNAP